MTYRNAPLHPLLRLIYAWLRFTTRVVVFVFYRRRLVVGREHLRFDGPAIVVSNHPCTMMDPLHTGLNIQQEMFFLANYGLFKNPVSNWILSRLFCIPVKRKEDVAEGEARDNDAAFEASFRHLEKNGVLYIAAEGVSWMNRYVRPFKTGAARIAFGAEYRNNWQLGVKIIPVGISYEAPRLFRSRVTVEYGAPIDPQSWVSANQQNHEKAISDFTEILRKQVQALTLDSGSEEGETFVVQSGIIAQNTRLNFSDQEKYLLLKNFLAKNLENKGLQDKIADYFSKLQRAGLTDSGLSNTQNPKSKVPIPASIILLAPFFLVGYAFWFLPCFLPWLLCKRLKLYPGYDSSIKILAGLFTFPLALWAGWLLAFRGFESPLWAWTSIIALLFCACLTIFWMDLWKRWREERAARIFQKKNPEGWQHLSEIRNQILPLIGLKRH